MSLEVNWFNTLLKAWLAAGLAQANDFDFRFLFL